jgi:hypothetical protein
MLLDSSLQLKIKVVILLFAYLLAFFPRFLLGFGLQSVWWKKCWIKYSTWILNYFNISNKKVCRQTLTLVAMLNAIASVGALQERSVLMNKLLKALQMALWGVVWLTNVQNVRTWRMCATCSTTCPWRTWSPGIPYLQGLHGNISWLYTFLADLFEMMYLSYSLTYVSLPFVL